MRFLSVNINILMLVGVIILRFFRNVKVILYMSPCVIYTSNELRPFIWNYHLVKCMSPAECTNVLYAQDGRACIMKETSSRLICAV